MRLFHTYQTRLWPIIWMLVGLVALQITSWMALPLYGGRGIPYYVPLHTLLETVSISISVLVFAVGWSSHEKQRPSNFMLLACTFAGVALLDFLHTISYQGMPDFFSPSGPEKAIDFWLAARALSALGFVAVAFLPWRTARSKNAQWKGLTGVLLLVALFAWVGTMHPEWTPQTYVAGQGLTAFKVASEYVLIALYGLAAIRFLQQMRASRPYDVVGLFAAVCVMALSEIFFTLYAGVTDVFNLLGHIYKVIAYGFIYKSLFVDGIKAPYQRMYESKILLQSVIEAIPMRVFWKDNALRYLGCNTLFSTDAGRGAPEQVIGKFDAQMAWGAQAELYRADDRAVMRSGVPKLAYEEPQTQSDGQTIWLRTSKVPLRNAGNEVFGILGIYEDITVQKQVNRELRLNHAAVNNSRSPFYRLSPQGIVLYANDHARTSLGYDRGELLGRPIWEIDADLKPEDWPALWATLKQEGAASIETRHRRKDGTIFEVEVASDYMAIEGDEYCFCFVRDITERKHVESVMEESLNRLLKLTSRVPGVVCQFRVRPDGSRCFPFASDGIREIYRVNPEDIRDDASRVDALVIAEDHPGVVASIQKSARELSLWSHEYRIRFDDGTLRWLFGNAFPEREADGSTLWHGFIADITERKQSAEKINDLAFFDQLTGLPNRRLLLDRLEHALSIGARQRQNGALLFVDLDNFKTLNDSRGHYKGDLLLQQVAMRLTHCVRNADTVARIGGDEFVVMLEDLSVNVEEAVSAAQVVAEKILFALDQPYQLATYAYHGTASIGITLFGDQSERIDEPLKRADLAMYQAKAAGRNGLSFFDPQMQAIVTARAALEAGLQAAVENSEFLLYYQAQIVGTRELAGVEALVRWRQPERGMVSPAEFIPLAEETGLILPIGKWVMHTACAQLAEWAKRPEMAHLTIAVNVSARQFHQADFVEQVLEALAQTGANPSRLKLELTESLLVSDVEHTIAKMASLKGVGVAFSLDDFGTGYSSLAYLKRLPLAQLKIDQGFIRDILTDPNDAAIAKMVIVLAESMGLNVIAEGVETEAQRELLASQGCHSYQGYLFSRPLPIDEFEVFAKRYQ